MKLQRYIRLLSYENAMKVIDFVESLKVYEDYACITSGGVSLGILEEDYSKVIDFLNSLEVRYEVSEEHPSKTTAKIVEHLKNLNLI